MQTAYIPVPKPPKTPLAPAWSSAAVMELYDLPFMDLVYRAQQTHRAHFDPNGIQLSSLLSIKTGGCPEDCGYCSQSSRYDTGLEAEKLMPLEEVLAAARAAQAGGAQRFCMGAAWRSPKPHHLEAVAEMVSAVKALGLETCVTLGMLREGQAEQLRDAGLDYYNHNLDTAPEFYGKVVTTRTYQDRLDTLEAVRSVGMSTCCGGIVGMGETRTDRAGLLHALATLPAHPDSLPINDLMPIPGTPLGGSEAVDGFEFVRMIAVARIVCPKTVVRLSAGREHMSRELQALCFMAGANSMFIGGKLLTTSNPDKDTDAALMADLGMKPMTMKTATVPA